MIKVWFKTLWLYHTCNIAVNYVEYSCRISDLILLQKRAVRLVDKADFNEHTFKIFKNYKMLKFKDLNNFHTCIFMYKASNIMLPENIQWQFCKNQDIHKYSTRHKDKMFITSVKFKVKTDVYKCYRGKNMEWTR